MGRMRRKSDLPQKICATCGLAFAWRKKWARDWDAVRHCSDRCRSARGARGGAAGGAAPGGGPAGGGPAGGGVAR